MSPKPGIKTTEFWLSLLSAAALTGLAVFLEGAGNHLGGAFAAIAAAVNPAIYALARAKTKGS